MADWPRMEIEEMSSEIDWSKAPEDATHCYEVVPEFFKKKDGKWMVWFGLAKRWAPSEIPSRHENLVYRPTSPSWSGEGLPPVGTVLEAIDKEINGGTWSKMVVLAVGKHGKDDCLIVAEVIEGQSRPGTMVASLYTGWERSFRPIRTPEQIAADEREAAILDIYQTICISRAQAEAIYDAGYRKP